MMPHFHGGEGPVLPGETRRPASALEETEALAGALIVPCAALFVRHYLERVGRCRHRVAEFIAHLEDAERRMNAAVIRLLALDPKGSEAKTEAGGAALSAPTAKTHT